MSPGEVVLHETQYGDPSLPPIVFCHGLFGQGRNWTSIARRAARYFRVLLLDMPNHGRSGNTDVFDYLDQAQIVVDHMVRVDRRPWRVVGHSMGGKIAMLIALLRPGLVERLVVVDMSPVRYPSVRTLSGYARALQAMDLSTLTNRDQADDRLRDGVPDPVIRAFLLQNLRRDGDGWRWQMNLDLLADSMDDLADWPDISRRTDLPGTFEGPVLWVKGEHSDYITKEYSPAMRALFPSTRMVTIRNAGHWVQSEQPEVFRRVVRPFLRVPLWPEVADTPDISTEDGLDVHRDA